MKLKFVKMAAQAFENFKECPRIQNIRDRLKNERYVMIFDVDGCLYTETAEIKDAERTYCEQMMKTFPDPKVDGYSKDDPDMLKKLKKSYNTTKKGLNVVFGLNFEEIKNFDFKEVYKYLKRDVILKKYIDSFNCLKFCFTNGFKEKAEPILMKLGLEGCFEIVFCSNDTEDSFIQKPARESFQFIEDFLEISPDQIQIYFFDDNKYNIMEAKRSGWTTFHVNDEYPIKRHLNEIVFDVNNNRLNSNMKIGNLKLSQNPLIKLD